MTSRLTAAFVFISILAAGTLSAPGQETERRIEISPNGDYFGFDLRSERDVSLQACQQSCINDRQCKAFTYNTKASWCFLKSDFGELKAFDGAVAGKIIELASEPDIGPAPALDFLTGNENSDALAFRREAEARAGRGAIADNAELLRTATSMLAAGNTQGGAQAITAATGSNSDNVDTWLSATRLILRYVRANGGGDWNIRQMGSKTAINAYRLTRTTSKRAEALKLLGQALEYQSIFRPALTAYKKSLELVASPELAAAYKDLRNREGFRITGNTVDAESNSPRICVQFSEPLVKSGVDYSDFVTVDGRVSGAVDASDRQICVTGLEHGESYRVAFRAGLPSIVDEILELPVTINSYVRDRQASVRFSGENFVLPRQMRQGIPVIGINADQAELELFRIGDRALANLLNGSDFLSQLGGYSIDQVRDDLGQAVWKGTLDLKTERNREVTTSFPVNEVLTEKQPGIYVLTAKARGSNNEYWSPRATQWFLVSDIGLTTYAGVDGLRVFSRSLDTAKPLQGIELTLIARNNEVLGSSVSDENGVVLFEPGLMRGTGGRAPSTVTARIEDETGAADFVFLDLTRAGFDLSDRGVTGRPAPGPVDVYTWTDRGIYRPGETIHAMSLARDDSARAVGGMPLTTILRRPDGVEARRLVSTSPKEGGHATDFDIPANAMRGVWRIEVHIDPDRDPISEKMVLVEDFVPDRIEFDLASEAETLSVDTPIAVNVDAKYLYGAPASDLALDGELRISTSRELATTPGYKFGLDDEDDGLANLITLGEIARTDSTGKARFDIELGNLPETTRPLSGDIIVRVREDGGRFVERSLNLPVKQNRNRIGIKTEFGEDISENSEASFRLIAVDGIGGTIDLNGLNWSLYRLERNYQWYRDSYSWRYEATVNTRLVADGQVDVGADSGAVISSPVKWGRYRMEIESPDAAGPASSVVFNAGYFTDGNPAETPDALEIALDKESYNAGETAKLKISSRFAGEALVVVGGDRFFETIQANIPAEGGEISIPVSDEWGAGVYVTATLFRPGSAQESRMPVRAIGTTWLEVEPGPRELSVSLELSDKARPDSALAIPIKVVGGVEGEKVFATIALIDVGILNLTRHEAPDPSGWYFGQRQLGLEIRDIYGRLIDGSLGAFGRIRTGGDTPGLAANGSPPTEKLLALYSGIVELDDAGQALVDFDVPQFNGTARIMAVAWSKSAVGATSQEIVIRNPVVLQAGLPKVMAPGDEAETILEIANTDGPAGTYSLSIAASEELSIGSVPSEIILSEGERKLLNLPISAQKSGNVQVTITATLGTDILVSRTQYMKVRPGTLPVASRLEIPLAANGGSVRIDGEILAQSLVEGSTVSINVSKAAGFDVASLLMKLDRYPYGCAEQTTSRALPLLYLSEFDAPEELLDTPEIEKRIAKAIERVLSYQSSSGSFGLWGPGDSDFWLDAYVTDFLTRAQEKSHPVPEQAMRLALANLQNKLGYQNNITDDGDAMAYALYVLARNRMASAGDLRYYADTKLSEFSSPLARAQIAAALSLYSDLERSGSVFQSSFDLAIGNDEVNLTRSDFGSNLRDGVAILTLASETRPVAAIVSDMIDVVEDIIEQKRHTSTQENAWMLLAARAAQERSKTLKLKVDGLDTMGAYSNRVEGEVLISNPIEIANDDSEPLTAVISALASPINPLPAGGEGFTIEREYYHLDGTPAQLIEVNQNDRFVVVLRVNELNAVPSRVLLTDLLPGGFEIENPRIIDSATLENFAWLGETDAAHSEFRDDRFVAAFNRSANSDRNILAAYMVRAVTPGRFALPAASVEDMYRAEFSARTASGFVEIKAAR